MTKLYRPFAARYGCLDLHAERGREFSFFFVTFLGFLPSITHSSGFLTGYTQSQRLQVRRDSFKNHQRRELSFRLPVVRPTTLGKMMVEILKLYGVRGGGGGSGGPLVKLW
jgi:hypothetical protein